MGVWKNVLNCLAEMIKNGESACLSARNRLWVTELKCDSSTRKSSVSVLIVCVNFVSRQSALKSVWCKHYPADGVVYQFLFISERSLHLVLTPHI